jgi:hypothetical protein
VRTNPQPSSTPFAGSRTSQLDERIAAAEAELSQCLAGKFGAIPPSQEPLPNRTGHCNYNGKPYDILNYNCHSAANHSVREDAANTGIISCNGDAPVQGSPAHHTFNYRREGQMIVYYNWGQTCRAPLRAFPPDIRDPDHEPCARVFCADQFNDEATKPLDPGVLVEEPGPTYCAENTQDLKSCNSCCQFRGKYWDLIPNDLRPTDRTFVQFMSQCYSTCSKSFGK